METKPGLRPHLILLILFAVTLALLMFTVDVQESDLAGVRPDLPQELDNQWLGYDVVFCQNLTCGRSWLVKDLTPDENGELHCPQNPRGEPCGSEVDTMAIGEKLNLPGDTVIFKKKYFRVGDQQETVFASVVISGKDRGSIHRPEICMPSQGNTIVTREVVDVPLPGQQEPLQVMVLNMTREDSWGNQFHSYYAYWFVGNGRETPHHWQRMMWLATDRILHNVSHRWAYISVSGIRAADPEDRSHYEEIRSVVTRLHPELIQTEVAQP